MTLDELKEAMEDIMKELMPSASFQTNEDGEIIICTGLSEDEDGELVDAEDVDEDFDFSDREDGVESLDDEDEDE